MIPTQSENPKGLHQRYYIQKIVPNGFIPSAPNESEGDFHLQDIEEGAEYFVMRLDEGGSDPEHINACRIGIHAYAAAIEHKLPELAKDLRERYPLREQVEAPAPAQEKNEDK